MRPEVRPDAGTVMTVRGPVATETLGATLVHEHILCDLVPEEIDRAEVAASLDGLRLDNYYDARRDARLVPSVMVLDDEDVAVSEVGRFVAAGGGCIVDVTSIGIGRSPEGLRRVAERSDMHVVMGASWYVQTTHPDYVAASTVGELQHRIEDEFEHGVVDGIRPGIIGEVGLAWPLHPDERKVLEASARAAATTGLPLSIHPGRDVAAPFEAVDIVREVGGDVSRTVMCHVDRTLFTPEDVLRLAATGVRVAFDLFGCESSYYPAADIDMPNDGRRGDLIRALIDDGRIGQVHVSHDIVLKTRLSRYGGEGYAHILERVTPILRRKGMTDDDLRTILVANPAQLLANARAVPAAP